MSNELSHPWGIPPLTTEEWEQFIEQLGNFETTDEHEARLDNHRDAINQDP